MPAPAPPGGTRAVILQDAVPGRGFIDGLLITVAIARGIDLIAACLNLVHGGIVSGGMRAAHDLDRRRKPFPEFPSAGVIVLVGNEVPPGGRSVNQDVL